MQLDLFFFSSETTAGEILVEFLTNRIGGKCKD